MITVPRMASVLRQVFEKEARALARSMGVIQRERQLNGSTLLLLLVPGWLHQPKAGRSRASTICWHVGGDEKPARHRRALDVLDRPMALRGPRTCGAVPGHGPSGGGPAVATLCRRLH
jgi:hypothetical protein